MLVEFNITFLLFIKFVTRGEKKKSSDIMHSKKKKYILDFKISFVFNNSSIFKFNAKSSIIQRKHYKKATLYLKKRKKKKNGKTTKTTNFPTLKRKSTTLTNKKGKKSVVGESHLLN